MGQVLAVVRLRLLEGRASGFVAILPLAFLAGLAVAAWAPGGDPAARAAVADRAVLGGAYALALLVALVMAALGLPGEVRERTALPMLASPVRRGAVALGGTLGYGILASLVLFGALVGGFLGLATGGVAAGRAAVRHFQTVENPHGAQGAVRVLSRDRPEVRIPIRVPDGFAEGEAVPVRLLPLGRYQPGERWDPFLDVDVGIAAAGAAPETLVRAHVPATVAALVAVPLAGVSGDDVRAPLELVLRRAGTGWSMEFPAGSVSVGSQETSFAASVFLASLCFLPLLFVAAAAAGAGAARFAAPTAAGLAVAMLLLYGGQDLLGAAAASVERQAVAATEALQDEDAHAPGDGHVHGDPLPPPSPVMRVLAGGLGLLVDVLPPTEPFDRSRALVERVAVPPRAVGEAALRSAPSLAVLLVIGWLLLRRRELIPT